MEILDGAIGTELIARGVELDGADWSARAIREAPEVCPRSMRPMRMQAQRFIRRTRFGHSRACSEAGGATIYAQR